MVMSRAVSRLLAIVLLLVAPCVAADPRAPLTVFAAASLKEALDAAAQAYERGTGTPVRVSYAASSALARQVEQRAPADVFLSADRDWVDYLAERRLLRDRTRHDLLGNSLVLIAPSGARLARVDLACPTSVTRALGEGRLALALTASVPAGKYARGAFDSLGMWSALKPRVVETESVRAALWLVARGEARMGVVYLTDALAEPRVRVLAAFPARSHPPIVYPVAVVAASRHPRAEHFATGLRSPPARAVFQRRGFASLR
jgi:molybdate transport system substrate-binding protein